MNRLLFILTTLFLSISVQSQGVYFQGKRQIKIKPDNLPVNAQSFINTLFPTIIIRSSYSDAICNEYFVVMSNDYEIIFDDIGNWIEINAPDNEKFPCGTIEQLVEEDIFITLMENEISTFGIIDYIIGITNIEGYGYAIRYDTDYHKETTILVDTDGNIRILHQKIQIN